MEYNKKCHKILQTALTMMETDKQLYVDLFGKLSAHGLVKHGDSVYQMNPDEREAFKDMQDNLSSIDYYVKNHFIDRIEDCSRSIKEMRKERQKKTLYQPMKDHKSLSEKSARQVLSDQFRTTSVSLNISPDVGIEPHDKTDKARYNTRNKIKISVSWKHSVYDRGFEIIKSGKGKHFVMSAVSENIAWLEQEGFTAFKVRTVFFKNGYGSEEGGWLVVDKSDDISVRSPLCDDMGKLAKPHAFHAELRRAASLIKSRQFRGLAKMLDA